MDDRSAGVVVAQERQALVVGQRVAPAPDDREHVLVGVVALEHFADLGRDQGDDVRFSWAGASARVRVASCVVGCPAPFFFGDSGISSPSVESSNGAVLSKKTSQIRHVYFSFTTISGG